jgi:superfamily II DNA helicase RecQ
LNLKLSITRDKEKERACLYLLKSENFCRMTSMIIYCTKKATCNKLANYLTQNGIKSMAYHAGKTDEERSYI